MRRSRFRLLLVLGLVVGMVPMAAAPAAAATSVFINEIHYDNDGTDAGEAIEVAGPAGTDISAWSIVLYNGANGLAYNTTNLTGSLVDDGSGFGFVEISYPTNGLQNGSPDGIALFDGSTVVQFLSYEGSFAAADGVASGLTSTDIGVAESGATQDIESLQLTGSGTMYEDFTWAANLDETFGAVNEGQSFGGGGGPNTNFIINEVDADQVSTDSAEFVELYDGGVGNTALDGLVLVLYNGNDDASYDSFDLDGQSTGADGYFVLCGDAGNTANCDLDVSPNTNLIQNGADAVALHIGNAADFPNDTPVTTTDLIDALVYDTNDGDDAGLLVLLNAGQPQVNEGDAGNSTADSNQRCPNGAGGARNTAAYTQAAPTPGGGNDCGVAPIAIINEVDADQSGTDAAEFVELYDGGVGNTALDGLVLVLYNGNDDASYLAFDLDGQATSADGYFVLCGDATNTANCDLDVDPNTNLIQNGADAVALHTGDATDFPNDTPVTTAGLIDALVYDTNDGDDAGLLVLLNAGQPQVNEGGSGNSTEDSNQRCPNGSGGARNTGSYQQWQPSPGAENACEDPPVVINDRFIHQIQGSGAAVTEPGTVVRVRGIVVGDYQGGSELDGFFLQEENTDADSDDNTSEGIFVFCGVCAVPVAEGNIVEVVGVQEEFFDMSQLDVGAAGPDGAVTVIDAGDNSGLATPSAVDLPAPASTTAEATFENVEGMLVTFTDQLTATEYFELGRYGQIVLSEGGRLRQYTNDNLPSATGFAAHQEDVAKRRIILDDINNFQNIDPVYHPRPDGFAVDNFIRGGDTILSLTGVMHWSWAGFSNTDAWRIRPQVDTPVQFTRSNPRDEAPEDVGGDIKVATLNVLNYFTTIDAPGNTCGPAAEPCRGAHSEAERVRQLDKIVAALAGMDADVVGLVELENNESASVASIATALSTATGAAWDYVDAGVTGGDVIKVAFIYNSDTVTASGSFAVLDTVDFTDPNNTGQLRNRAALAETFTENITGESFTAVVNHLKSKGSGCGFGDDDTTTGQGNCNVTRTLAAAELADWLATDPTGSGDPDVIVLGDLNAYAMEDPIAALKAGGDDLAGTADDYTDLVDAFIGATEAYSFVFSGEWGYLDHALANGSMASQVTGVTHWHINADEANLLDYNDTIQDANEQSFEAKPGTNPLYADDAFRSSDHDPVIVGLNLADPMGDKQDVVAELDGLLPTGDDQTDKRLNKAIEAINDSLNPAWWTGDQTITDKKVFDNERQAIAQLDLIVDDGSPYAAAALDAIFVLLNADRQLAQIELIAAIDRGGNAAKIADAQTAMADAAAFVAAGLYVDAVNSYKAAWDAATKA